MSDAKLTELPSGGPVSAGDLFYSVQAGISVKQPASTLGTFFSRAPGYTVSTLPSGGPVGSIAYVTDGAPSQSWAATVLGGGTARYLVWFNGASWTIIGDGGYAPPAAIVPTYYIYGF